MVNKFRPWTIRGALLLFAAIFWFAATQSQAQPENEWRWYKGNLHTHTIHSDGDSSPEVVVRWYKEHRYHFLVLSDHNYFTEPGGLNSVLGASERFLLIGGEEVTSKFEQNAVHLNAYGISRLVPPEFGSSVLDTIQQNVNAIEAAGGLSALNHPNFRWSVSPDEMAAVKGLDFFEVYNGHPTVHNEGGGGHPGLEQMWDVALTAGRRILAVATDDAHVFKRWGPEYSNPGRGWVRVRARELTSEAIVEGLRAGNFYASTGVELTDVERDGGLLRVRIEPDGDFRYTTRYYGAGGKLLEESSGLESQYKLKPGDRYARATITDSAGRRAWTQPVFAH